MKSSTRQHAADPNVAVAPQTTAVYVCAEGHRSPTTDYCVNCGLPIVTRADEVPDMIQVSDAAAEGAVGSAGSAGSAVVPPPLPPTDVPSADAKTPPPLPTDPSAATAPRMCPHCFADNPSAALFCESCGYDFTTGQRPQPQEVHPGVPVPGAPLAPVSAGVPSSADPATSTAATWVVEVWVDPRWYAVQEVNEPCPAAGPPQVVGVDGDRLLIGRQSESRNIHPEVDMASDTGVSRRHALLTRADDRWWVQDLQSANGTYVGTAEGDIPTRPLAAADRVELEPKSCIYVGAWSRIMVRRVP